MIDPTVRRTVELATSAADLWRLLTDDRELPGWLGAEVDLPVQVGRLGRVVDPDGTVRRLVVDTVEEGRRIGFTWWIEGGESSASTVELTIEPAADGAASTLTVVEAPAARAGGLACSISPSLDEERWSDRLLGLEIAVAGRLPAFA